jgi:hypothetical protein
MATAPDKNKTKMDQPTREQLRRDRISLAIVFVVFGGLIALMIWLATIAPTTGTSSDYFYPIFP